VIAPCFVHTPLFSQPASKGHLYVDLKTFWTKVKNADLFSSDELANDQLILKRAQFLYHDSQNAKVGGASASRDPSEKTNSDRGGR